MEKRIVIIDGNSLVNRAYYAMQRPMITKEGIYTQGVYGFLNMLFKIKKDYEAGYVAVCFDLKSPTFRHKEYEDYKAGRKKMPPELAMQMPILKEVLAAMNIKTLELEGFEADDIIGTLAKKGEEQGLIPLIITGDKDELQLATDVTKVIITKKGISQFETYDRKAMIDKYGFTPEQFIDFKGLMGDQSDNIPGVPGVGEKTAHKLILEFGSVENLIENTDKIPQAGLRTKIEENINLAIMSKRLATIHLNVPIEIDFEECKWESPNKDALVTLYRKLEFNSFLKKMEATFGEIETDKTIIGNIDDGTGKIIEMRSQLLPDESKNVEEKIYELVQLETLEELKILERSMEEAAFVVVKLFSDDNHTDDPNIYGASLGVNNKMFYVNENLLREMAKIINRVKPKIVGHYIKKDYYSLMHLGVTHFDTYFDTAIAQYLLDSGRSNYNLTTLVQEYFFKDLKEEKEFLKENGQIDIFSQNSNAHGEYGKDWCKYVYMLKEVLEPKILQEGLDYVFNFVELPLVEPMAFMEKEGFAVDQKELETIGKDISKTIESLTVKIYELAGEEFNINSPAQLGTILFEKLNLPPSKKTKKGFSTGAEVLERLKAEHGIIPLILEYRTVNKLKGTYIDGLIPLIHKDKKIHAHFTQTVAATGRLSCVEPNLQNIPIRQELGRTIRKAFIPSEPGNILLGADYSQIELRVLAHMSEDPVLIDAFNQGEDIHKVTAARVLGVDENQITPLQRSRAKAVNFGVIYGMSAFGLSSEIQVTRKEADEYIKEYFNKHAKVKEFMDQQVALCKAQGFVETIVGRKRYISEITASNFMVRQLGERLAMNSPIQGSAADIIKIAMIKVYKALKDGGYKSKLILQVHDELLIETTQKELSEVQELLRKNMEEAMTLKVKLAVDLNQGENWYQLK